MKNQYFGDINDYRKYGLLRAIQLAADLRLTVGWMLTPDDGSRDGGSISYLSQAEKWERFDPVLFRALRGFLSSQGVARSVAQMESTALIAGAVYFRDLVPDDREARSRWFERLLALAAGSDLVFLDPDNGLEVRSKPIGRRGSSKYSYWHEVEALWQAGFSLLIYQHFPRKKREAFVSAVKDQLWRRTGARLVEAIETPRVVFLLAGQVAHSSRLSSALELVDRTWPGQLSRRKGDAKSSAGEEGSRASRRPAHSMKKLASGRQPSRRGAKQQIVGSVKDLDRLEAMVCRSAEETMKALAAATEESPSGLGTLALLKFTAAGRDPLDAARPLNLVEQLNQSFTYLASITAARWLLERHPDCAPLTLNLGTSPGSDIESRDGRFVAETFAATHPDSNRKLGKDIARVQKSSAPHRFVFFLSPVDAKNVDSLGVDVVRLHHPVLDELEHTLTRRGKRTDSDETLRDR